MTPPLSPSRALLLAAMLATVVALPLSSSAQLITVCQSPGICDFTTIEAAFASSPASGTEIRVTDSGTYVPPNTLTFPSGIYLNSPNGATINGSVAPMFVIPDLGGGMEIEGFSIINFGDIFDVQVTFGTSFRVTNCLINPFGGRVFSLNSSGTTSGSVIMEQGSIAGAQYAVWTAPFCGPIDVEMYDVTITTPLLAGISINTPGNHVISGVTINGTSFTSIGIEIGQDVIVGSTVTITNCAINNVVQDAIRLEGFGSNINITSTNMTGGQNGIIYVSAFAGPNKSTVTLNGPGTISGFTSRGIYLVTPAHLIVDDYTITNSLSIGAGIVALDAAEANLTVTNSVISSQATRGIHGVNNAISATGSTWTITDTQFINNFGSDLVIESPNGPGITLNLARNRFQQRVLPSETRVVEYARTTASIVNCVFDMSVGEAIFIGSGGSQDSSITHCTIASGPTNNVIGLVNLGGGAVTVRNSIFHTDGGTSILDFGFTVNENYNIRTGIINLPALGSNSLFGVSPGFVLASNGTPGSGDFTLAPGSPAPGAGLDLGVTTDITGGPRPNPIGSHPDLGAYESVLLPVELNAFDLL